MGATAVTSGRRRVKRMRGGNTKKSRISSLTWWGAGLCQEDRIQYNIKTGGEKNESFNKIFIQ